jgi:hypothetical protein
MPCHTRMLGAARGRSSRLMTAAIASSALISGALASPAGAATPPPQSAATCFGSLARGSATDPPNTFNYRFRCDGRITAYTVLANRRPRDFEVIDNFSTTANVFDPRGNIVSDQSFGCEGNLPGDGINCNAGVGSFMGAGSSAVGSLELADPYCKNLPAHAKPGTFAQPQAVVQLVVTDTSGAQDGPFRLSPSSTCAPRPDRAPKQTKTKHKTKKKTKHRVVHHSARA